MVSVQPTTAPASLVYFGKRKKNSIMIDSEAVAAKSVPYDFKLFSTGNFEELKETYANEIALNLDMFIANKLQKTNVFHELTENPDKMFDFIKNSNIDYIITSQSIADKLSGIDIDLYALPNGIDLVDPSKWTALRVAGGNNLVSAIGRYPTNDFDSKYIFVPYILFMVGMQTTGTCRTAYFRAGWYEVETNVFDREEVES